MQNHCKTQHLGNSGLCFLMKIFKNLTFPKRFFDFRGPRMQIPCKTQGFGRFYLSFLCFLCFLSFCLFPEPPLDPWRLARQSSGGGSGKRQKRQKTQKTQKRQIKSAKTLCFTRNLHFGAPKIKENLSKTNDFQ